MTKIHNPYPRTRRGPNILNEIRRQLDLEEYGPDQNYVELVRRLIRGAMEGDKDYMKMLMDRVLPAKLVLEGSEDGAPIVRIFTNAGGTSGPTIDAQAQAEETVPVLSVVAGGGRQAPQGPEDW